jgi:hypothetical protein
MVPYRDRKPPYDATRPEPGTILVRGIAPGTAPALNRFRTRCMVRPFPPELEPEPQQTGGIFTCRAINHMLLQAIPSKRWWLSISVLCTKRPCICRRKLAFAGFSPRNAKGNVPRSEPDTHLDTHTTQAPHTTPALVLATPQRSGSSGLPHTARAPALKPR